MQLPPELKTFVHGDGSLEAPTLKENEDGLNSNTREHLSRDDSKESSVYNAGAPEGPAAAGLGPQASDQSEKQHRSFLEIDISPDAMPDRRIEQVIVKPRKKQPQTAKHDQPFDVFKFTEG